MTVMFQKKLEKIQKAERRRFIHTQIVGVVDVELPSLVLQIVFVAELLAIWKWKLDFILFTRLTLDLTD